METPEQKTKTLDTEKPAYQQLGDEMSEVLTRWARTGLVTPQQTADMLQDALAQVMALSVKSEMLPQALAAADKILQHKVYAHLQRIAHLRKPGAQAEAPTGKPN